MNEMLVIAVALLFVVIFGCFLLIKVLRNAFRLAWLKRHIEDSKEDVAMLINNELHVCCINTGYDKSLFPYLMEEIVKVRLWDLLLPEHAALIYKGYQNSLIARRAIKMEYSDRQKGHTFSLSFRFVPLFHGYVVCYIRRCGSI